jgi:hypothetical protein
VRHQQFGFVHEACDFVWVTLILLELSDACLAQPSSIDLSGKGKRIVRIATGVSASVADTFLELSPAT